MVILRGVVLWFDVVRDFWFVRLSVIWVAVDSDIRSSTGTFSTFSDIRSLTGTFSAFSDIRYHTGTLSESSLCSFTQVPIAHFVFRIHTYTYTSPTDCRRLAVSGFDRSGRERPPGGHQRLQKTSLRRRHPDIAGPKLHKAGHNIHYSTFCFEYNAQLQTSSPSFNI